jgi:hypothetical protein
MSFPSLIALDEITSISSKDIPVFLAVCAGYYCYRIALVNGPLAALGRALKVKRLHKFVHRTFDAIHYVIGAAVGLLALSRRPYGHCFAYAKNCHDYMRQDADGFLLTVAEKIYHTLFFVYYTVDLAFLGTNSDRLMMTLHHIVTLTEITIVIILQSPVVALSIMLLHDVTDVPLYLAKFCIYIKAQVASTVFLGLFATSVTYFRIVNFPMIIWVVAAVGWGTSLHPFLYTVATVSLVVLYAMHVIWEYKILQHVAIALRGEEIKDKRSDASE